MRRALRLQYYSRLPIVTGVGMMITQAIAGNDPEKPGIPERHGLHAQ